MADDKSLFTDVDETVKKKVDEHKQKKETQEIADDEIKKKKS